MRLLMYLNCCIYVDIKSDPALELWPGSVAVNSPGTGCRLSRKPAPHLFIDMLRLPIYASH